MEYFYLMTHRQKWLFLSLAWWLFAIMTIYFMPLRKGDELHYLTVAWEMYKNHIYLSTYLGEILDLEKTPLLYWPIVAGWHIFGVNDIWPFIYTYLIGWLNLILTGWLARQLFPGSAKNYWLAIIILMTGLYWPTFYDDIRFEGMTALFGLLFLNLICRTLIEDKFYNWLLAAIAFGLCTFSKGPVAFIYYLPLALLLAYWQKPLEKRISWYLKLASSVGVGLIIPLSWLIIVYFQHDYLAVHYLLFGQISKRVGLHFSLDQSLSFFKNMLPWSLIFVFCLIKQNWQKSQTLIEKKIIILSLFILFQIIFFSFEVKLQAPHYLIPIYPIAAILMAEIIQRYLNMKHCLQIAGLFLLGLLIYDLSWQRPLRNAISLEPASQKIKLLENRNQTVVEFGAGAGYQNFGFLGRLNFLLTIIGDDKQKDWLTANPNGWIVTTYKKLPECPGQYQSWPINNKEFLLLISVKNYLSCESG